MAKAFCAWRPCSRVRAPVAEKLSVADRQPRRTVRSSLGSRPRIPLPFAPSGRVGELSQPQVAGSALINLHSRVRLACTRERGLTDDQLTIGPPWVCVRPVRPIRPADA
jgi:hypothetical protein